MPTSITELQASMPVRPIHCFFFSRIDCNAIFSSCWCRGCVGRFGCAASAEKDASRYTVIDYLRLLSTYMKSSEFTSIKIVHASHLCTRIYITGFVSIEIESPKEVKPSPGVSQTWQSHWPRPQPLPVRLLSPRWSGLMRAMVYWWTDSWLWFVRMGLWRERTTSQSMMW